MFVPRPTPPVSGRPLWRPAEAQVSSLSIALLLGVFSLDALTPNRLVFGILFAAPIALSGLAGRPSTTRLMIFLALIANGLAGVVNGLAGGWSAYDLANRVLSLLSALLVGFLTLRFREASTRAALLDAEEYRAQHERALRELTQAVSGPYDQAAFLDRAAQALLEFAGAGSVVLGAVSKAVLRAPYSAANLDGEGYSLPAPGQRLPTPFLARPAGSGLVWAVQGGDTLLARLPRPGDDDILMLMNSARVSVGEVEHAVSVLRPLLERTRLLEELQDNHARLERHNGVIRELVYAFSHDLRTPLMANAMSMQNALKGAYGPLPDDYCQTLRNGLDANAALLELAEKLLLVAKYEAGEPSPDPTVLDLRELALGTVAQMEGLARERGVTLEPHLEESARVLGQRGELRRAVQNVLENAVKFSPPGGTVRLSLASADGQAELQVSDEGPGLSAGAERQMYQRFRGRGPVGDLNTPAGPGTSGPGNSGLGRSGLGGTGLGLYLTQQVMAAHSGEVQYNRTQGARTVFSLRLPLLERA
ncbi:HAMP domain-containing sensor histidine kinase [Deinococcus radiomollis]|uniref:sensor histidine kinase n=1 Tax=Deinococcus radiomollis TaxID=468916 RepID=UPI0038923B24